MPGLRVQDEVARVRKRLLRGMVAYLRSAGGAYTRDDVEHCKLVIDSFLVEMRAPGLTEDRARAVVGRTVAMLNDLNSECRGLLIETEQREDLVALIHLGVRQAGFDTSNDWTEGVREW